MKDFTSMVLLDVVLHPRTPGVAMTSRMLSPSTNTLYLVSPLDSSLWITALATVGKPC